MDCTLMGASPPTSTSPTLIWRVLRRGAKVGMGGVGMPRLTVMTFSSQAGAIQHGEPSTFSTAVVQTQALGAEAWAP